MATSDLDRETQSRRTSTQSAFIIKVIRRTVPRNHSSRFLFYILYIFAATCFGPYGHYHAEYTIILGRYLTHNGSVVLCYRSRLLCMISKYCRCLK
jgi:hypothetical protein